MTVEKGKVDGKVDGRVDGKAQALGGLSEQLDQHQQLSTSRLLVK